jgi:hypothetical protein
MRRSSFTECCVGFVFSSPAASMNGTSVTWTVHRRSRADLAPELAIASRNGSDSMSPTVPPISEMTTSVGSPRRRADARLDLVRDVRDHLHGRAEEVALALLAQTVSQIAPRCGSRCARKFSSTKRS